MIVEHNQSKYYKIPYPTTNTGTYDNKWKFNGKELDDATQMYYYGARYYDPRISIFVSVDPLAEKTMEPYSYVGNNPIMFTDPTGMSKEGPGDPPKEETLPELVINVRSKVSQFCQGAKIGLIGVGSDAVDFFKSLGTEEGWLNLARSQELMLSPAVNSNGDSYVKNERQQIYNSASHTLNNLDQLTAYDWGYGFGYVSGSVALTFATRNVSSRLGSVNYFGARGGYGLLGENGWKIGNYRMDLMYANPQAGLKAGTVFSLKQMKQGGTLWRWDYGNIHKSTQMRFHSTVRFQWNGEKYGSSAQRNWYPSSLKAPFFKTLKK